MIKQFDDVVTIANQLNGTMLESDTWENAIKNYFSNPDNIMVEGSDYDGIYQVYELEENSPIVYIKLHYCSSDLVIVEAWTL